MLYIHIYDMYMDVYNSRYIHVHTCIVLYIHVYNSRYIIVLYIHVHACIQQ